MSAIGAQQRALNDAEMVWIEARSALDLAKQHAEQLNEAHLVPEDLFWESIGAIDGMCGMLDDLIASITSEL